MAAVETNAASAASSSRPAARPSTQASRHHLEPNPFEQSFSSKPSSTGRSASPDGGRGRKSVHKSTKSDSGVDEVHDRRGDGSSSQTTTDSSKRSSGGPTTPGSTLSKRILPPVASIASPSSNENAGTMQYPWATSLTGSLRAGPLSPAMLAGPQNFDPTQFRTGLTPDLSSFKTGLTPLGTAGSFPPPSPNTAAFLAMVTNGSASGLSGAAITPNTLNALSGGHPLDVNSNNGTSNPAADPSKQLQQGYMNGMPQQHHQPGEQRDGDTERPRHAENGGRAGNGTNQAASGLFLLSQAHQELSKRGDDGPQDQAAEHAAFMNGQMPDAKSLYSNVPGGASHLEKVRNAATSKAQSKQQQEQFSQQQPKNGKRKNSGVEGKANMKKSKAMRAEEMSPSGESDELLDESTRPRAGSMLDDGQMSDFGGDDDEKRRNFLERNRQAALKCRQRKKAWLASLQAKVEYLQSDNEHLQGTVGALRNEVMFLKSQLMQAQRQMNGQAVGGGPDPMQRHGVSAPMGMPNGMMPTAMTQVPHSSIHAMAAAAAAATSGAGNMMGNVAGAYSQAPQQQHIPRQTHMPLGAHFGAQNGKQPTRQGSVQAV